jgi:uncharacterized protein YcgL (UPF0745 family)
MLALFDIDGVIANDKHRTRFAVARQWDWYFQSTRMFKDAVWPEGRLLLAAHIDADDQVGFLTGRREDRRRVTELWMRRNKIPFTSDWLLMRQLGDRRILADVKVAKVKELIAQGYEVVLYEDDPHVVDSVNAECGEGTAVLCTWSVKEKAMIKMGRA